MVGQLTNLIVGQMPTNVHSALHLWLCVMQACVHYSGIIFGIIGDIKNQK